MPRMMLLKWAGALSRAALAYLSSVLRQALRLENEKLRQRLQTDGEIADVAVAAPARRAARLSRNACLPRRCGHN